MTTTDAPAAHDQQSEPRFFTIEELRGDAWLLSIEQVAQVLGYHAASVYEAIRRGEFPIPVIRPMGRRGHMKVRRRDLERYLEGD